MSLGNNGVGWLADFGGLAQGLPPLPVNESPFFRAEANVPSVLEIAESKLPLFFLLTVPSLCQAFQGASDATSKVNCIKIMALR